MTTVLEQITHDLDWRESELGSLKIMLKNTEISEKQREVLLRAAWAMLYAHYEGYSKFCLTLFYGEVERRANRCGDLPEKTRIFALTKVLRELRNLDATEMLRSVETFSVQCLDARPVFPEVETNSNLWPNQLSNILQAADLSVDTIQSHKTKIDTLVSRRNGIAHGEKNIIKEVEYYLTYEEAVYDIMYSLAYDIDRRLSQPPYK